MRECRAARRRRIRATPLSPGIRGYSYVPTIMVRHPEVRAERASKDAAEVPGTSPFEGRAMRGRLRRRAYCSLPQIGSDLLAGFDQALHRFGRLVEHRALGAVELDFDDALHPL